MPFNPAQFRSLLSSETRFMCDILSPGFDPLGFGADKLHSINPDKLLRELTIHRLYPHFYKIWSNGLQLNEVFSENLNYDNVEARIINPHQLGGQLGAKIIYPHQLEAPQWLDFNARLKQMVEHNRIQMLQKTATLVRIVKEFEKEGIPVIALKGPALANRIYGDVAMRYSWDTDILIPPDFIDTAAGILLSLQYDCNLYDKRASLKQKGFARKYFKHLSFTNAVTKGCVELHWELTQLKTLKSAELPDIWETRQETFIGDTRIYVLQPSLELIYLMAHSADHSFYRLAWLLDIVQIIHKNPELSQLDFKIDTKTMELNKIALTLGNIVFHYPKEIANSGNRAYLNHCLQTIQSIRGNTTKPLVIREYWGKVLLTPNLIIKPRLFYPLLTSPKDWEILRLPDCLFFMYFLLRPFLYIYRLLFAIGS